MATIERVSRHDLNGRVTKKIGQTTKTAQVVFAGLFVCCLAFSSGCRTGNSSNPFSRSSYRASVDASENFRDSIADQNPPTGDTKKQDLSLLRSAESKKSFERQLTQASYQTDAEDIPGQSNDRSNDAALLAGSIAVEDPRRQAKNDEPGDSNVPDLSLQQVLTSVTDCYPEIEIAIGEVEAAQGKTLASWGEFDSVVSAHSIAQPLGFYQTYRNGAGVTRPLYGGGEVYGAYRIGDGNFEPWYGERETNEGGELKAGFSLPLLKDRAIDKRRTGVRSAQLDQSQIEANVASRLLEFERFATHAFWDWVASGQAVEIQHRLLFLAEQRVEQINVRIEKGDLALISKIDNDRFIAKRKNGLIKARRSLEKSAIKLSLFYRDQSCRPIIADISQLPTQFPANQPISVSQSTADIESALLCRPELIELDAAREQACVQTQYAQNLLLPKLDVKGFAGQDLGGATSSKGDKTPFELQLGVFAEVPIQRREGAGKVQAAQAKISQIDAKRRFVSDKIRAEIQDAASAVNAAAEQIEQSLETVRLNERSLELGRLSFEEGDIDLLALNIYESSVADAQLQLLEAQFKYFSSLATYKAFAKCEAFSDLANF